MVEGSALPGPLFVTGDAVRRKAGFDMIRLPCCPEVGFVAGITVRRPGRKAAAAVAGLAIERPVDALEAEPGIPLVVPEGGSHIFPGLRGVAVGTLGAQAETVTVVLPPLPVTDLAILRRPLEDEIDVTFPAAERPVLSQKREVRPVVGSERRFRCGLRSLGLSDRLLLSPPGLDAEDEKQRRETRDQSDDQERLEA